MSRYDDRGYGEGRERDARVRGAARRGRAESGIDRPNWGGARSDYGRHAYGARPDEMGRGRSGYGRRSGGERDWWDRAGDEVRSWLGDEEAERRRSMDERLDERRERMERWQEARREGWRGRSGGGWEGARWRDNIARNVMTRDVVTVRPDDAAEHAARLMLDCDCGAIPVVERDGRLVGMVTDRDITIRLVARGEDVRRARVDDCMTDEVFACREDDSVEDCMREMARHQVRRLPIVDDRGRIVGIVSQADLARHAEEHKGEGERRGLADTLCAVSEPTSGSYR